MRASRGHHLAIAVLCAALVLPPALALPLPQITSGLPTWGAWNLRPLITDNVFGLAQPSIQLKIGPTGEPHVAFLRTNPASHPAFIERLGGLWGSPTILDNTPGAGVSLDVDRAGNPHVAWRNISNQVRYATRLAGVWSFENVAQDSPGRTSIAVRLDGTIFLAFGYDLKVGIREPISGTWSFETVDAPDNGWPSIALDSGGNPHIAYGHGLALTYASRSASGVWTKEIIDPNCGPLASLAIDSHDVPHISCVINGAGVWYATKTNLSWAMSQVDRPSSTSLLPGNAGVTIAVDPAGNPHVAYQTLASGSDPNHTGHLKYAIKLNGAWIIETVDEIGFLTGIDPSIAVDPHGRPHIVYDLFQLHTVGQAPPVNDRLQYAEPAIATILGATGN